MTQNFVEMLLRQYFNPDQIIKKYQNVKASRSAWETKWQAIQDQVFPDYRDYLNKTKTDNPASSKIRNHSSVISGKINKVVSLLSSQTCDPSVQWLDLKFDDENLNHNLETRNWLFQCKEQLYKLFSNPESGFYTSTYSFHLDWFTLGTACREIILRRDTGHIQFNCVSMQDIYIEVSGYGNVDTYYRRLNLTAKQALSIWGQNLHPNMIRYASQEDSTSVKKKWEFIEYVIPNPLRDKIPSVNYASCVIDKMNKHIVDIGLHAYSPYVVARFFLAPGEIYGRSYVWNSMPDIIAINRLSKRTLQGIDFATLPITLVKDITSLPVAQITPGAFVQGLDANGRPTFQQVQYAGNVSVGIEYLNMKLNDLEEGLVARDIFPAEATNMTATEVNERKIQAFSRIRPLLVMLENEDLNKTVLRTLKLLEQIGQLPMFPYESLKIDPQQLPDPISMLRVVFSGQMAKMQRTQEIVNSDLLVQKTIQCAQTDPSVLDRVNLDQLIALDAEIYGVNPSIINSDEAVQQIREARAQQQQAEQQAQTEAVMLDNLVKLKEAGIYENGTNQ